MTAHDAPLDVPGALWRRRWLIVVLVVAGAIGGLIASLLAPTTYTSTAKVLIKPTALNPPGSVPLASAISLPTEAELVRSDPVIAEASQGLADDAGVGLAARVTVGVETDNQVLSISVTAPTAEGARTGATAVAESYLAYRADVAAAEADAAIAQAEERLTGLRADLAEANERADTAAPGSTAAKQAADEAAQLNGQIAIWEHAMSLLNISAVDPGTIVVAASLPAEPSSPDRTQDVVRGALAGLLVGILVALILESRANARRRERS